MLIAGEAWTTSSTKDKSIVTIDNSIWTTLGIDASYVQQYNGTCAYLQLSTNNFTSNYAEQAGAVAYATNSDSLNVTCKPDSASEADLHCDTSMWVNNTVGSFGYGPMMAFPPALLNVSLPAALTYVSNGNDKLPMTMYAVDQRGSKVTAGTASACP